MAADGDQVTEAVVAHARELRVGDPLRNAHQVESLVANLISVSAYSPFGPGRYV
ncbi:MULTISPECIES: hypothetical protein [Streptomyces]|uniref:hypothetical protein n=1 Tax=Streptomyces TaxID=1883 RepID=UPI0033AEA5AD